jgi:hypothetical protein
MKKNKENELRPFAFFTSLLEKDFGLRRAHRTTTLKMEAVARYVDQVRVPTGASNVWKDECAFSFETPVTVTTG